MAPPNRHKKQLKVEEPEEEENEDITNTDESESGDESDSSNESNSSSEEESDDNEDQDVEEREPVDDDRNSIGFSDKELVRVTYQLPLRLWNWLKKTEPILKEQGNIGVFPASPNVIEILQDYVEYFVKETYPDFIPSALNPHPHTLRVHRCVEFVDILRIAFDNLLEHQLLYDSERDAYEKAKYTKPVASRKTSGTKRQKQKSGDSIMVLKKTKMEVDPVPVLDDKPISRHTRFSDSHSGVGSEDEHSSESDRKPPATLSRATSNKKWHLLKKELEDQEPKLPSLICCGHHLLRLMLIMPRDVFAYMPLTPEQGENMKKHIELLFEFLKSKDFIYFLQVSD